MNINKAIEINTQELAPLLVGKKIEWQEAFWLGIEALRGIQYMREHPGVIYDVLLPGED